MKKESFAKKLVRTILRAEYKDSDIVPILNFSSDGVNDTRSSIRELKR